MLFLHLKKVLTNTLQFVFKFLNISHPLRCFIILSPMTNIDFLFFSPFGLSFLWSPAKIVFVSYNYYLKILRLPCSGWPSYVYLILVYPSGFLSRYCRSILECFYFGFPCCRWFLCFVVVPDWFGFQKLLVLLPFAKKIHRHCIYCIGFFLCYIFPGVLRQRCRKCLPCTILSKYVWDNIAQENYLYNVDPERTDIALQKSNPGNVVLNLPGPTLYKAIICAMLSHSPQSSQFWLNMSETTLYRINYLYNVGPELIAITGSNL